MKRSAVEQSRPILTVDDLTFRISAALLTDPALQSAVVRGELAELKRHTSGHVYFTLLGGESRISCALFRNYLPYVPKWPRDGDEILAEGSVSIYPPRGNYQLIVRRLVPVGEGAAERARRELKARLEGEGLFDPRLKRPLPRYPEKVAVVTSRTGAALQDVIAVSGKRMPSCSIVVVPAQVQGYDAPEQIVRALSRAGRCPGLDCVLLVRGGGSRDDLVPFDDERVVRAVRNCPVPIVSGVGHEVDETLCDLAADVFAPTPSAAAERVFPDRREILRHLAHWRSSMTSEVEGAIASCSKDLVSCLQRGGRAMERELLDRRSSLALRSSRLQRGMERRLCEGRERLGKAAASLDGLSPLKSFDRGFVLCEKDGQPVRSVLSLDAGDEVNLRFRDGDATAMIGGRGNTGVAGAGED